MRKVFTILFIVGLLLTVLIAAAQPPSPYSIVDKVFSAIAPQLEGLMAQQGQTATLTEHPYQGVFDNIPVLPMVDTPNGCLTTHAYSYRYQHPNGAWMYCSYRADGSFEAVSALPAVEEVENGLGI